MSWYTGGALTVTAGLTGFSLATGALLSQAKAGDTLEVAGVSAIIASIETNQTGTLVFAWPGSTVVAGTNYLIAHTGSGWQSTVTINETLAAIVAELEAGLGFRPDAVGTLAERNTYDGEARGFIFLRTDSDPLEIYVKATDSSGDWAGPSNFMTGPAGPTGPQGGDRYDLSLWDNGRPATGDTLFKFLFTTTVAFPIGLAASRAKVGTTATASTVFSLQKNGVEFGTVTFAIGSATGVFAAASATSFAAGDLLTVVAPDPRDDTLADVIMTLTGSR